MPLTALAKDIHSPTPAAYNKKKPAMQRSKESTLPRQGFERDIPIVPTHYIKALARFMRRQGISPDVLLAGTGIPPGVLDEPDVYLSVAQVERVVTRACEFYPRQGLGFEFGKEFDLATHGLLGFSILRRENVRELVVLVVNFVRVRLPLLEIRVVEAPDSLTLVLEETWQLGRARQFVTEMYLGSMYSLCRLATTHLRMECGFARPRDLRAWRDTGLPEGLLFGRPRSQLTLYFRGKPGWVAENLGPVLVAGLGLRPAPAEGEEEQEILLRTRHCIMADPGRDCTLEQIATRLGMSARTLRRHLQEAGQCFSDMRNDIRREFAMRLLKGSNMSLEAVAERLGYGDQASFSKAFSSWTGTSPGRYRRTGLADGAQPSLPGHGAP